MNSKWMYWLMKARSGWVATIGVILVWASFRRGHDGFGYALVVATVVGAALVIQRVDLKNAGKLPG